MRQPRATPAATTRRGENTVGWSRLRRVRRSRPGRCRSAAALVVLGCLLAGCRTGAANNGGRTDAAPHPEIRVASFDFPESRVLAEIYAQALERRGFRVSRLAGLGAREVVQPALQQGLIDVVPEYAGSALRFLGLPPSAAEGSATAVHARLAAALAGRGVAVLDFAAAEDKNGVVVTAGTARSRGLHRISDLRPIARSLTFGGPPECPQRPYCLLGLRSRYGLRFGHFQPQLTREATAQALQLREVDVGMLETTYPHLGGAGLVLLTDDLRLQPLENVVPMVRRSVLRSRGARFAQALNNVSARLDTSQLIELNRRSVIDGLPLLQIAANWLNGEGLH